VNQQVIKELDLFIFKLKVIYFQAVEKQTFNIEFERIK
jgi:hypothetical protein